MGDLSFRSHLATGELRVGCGKKVRDGVREKETLLKVSRNLALVLKREAEICDTVTSIWSEILIRTVLRVRYVREARRSALRNKILPGKGAVYLSLVPPENAHELPNPTNPFPRRCLSTSERRCPTHRKDLVWAALLDEVGCFWKRLAGCVLPRTRKNPRSFWV